MMIQNPEVGKIIREQAQLTLTEGYPNNLNNTVQAVIDVSPDFHKEIVAINGASSSTGTLTVYTAVPKKGLYLTGFVFALNKDATCDVASGTVNLTTTIGGISKTILGLCILTLTAQTETVSVQLRYPIKIDPNVAVTTAITFTAGLCRRSVTLYGYEYLTNT